MSLLIAMLAAMRGGAVMGQSKELVQRRYDNVWINRPGQRRMAVACVGVKIKAKTLGGKKSGVATTRSCGRNACENSFWLRDDRYSHAPLFPTRQRSRGSTNGYR